MQILRNNKSRNEIYMYSCVTGTMELSWIVSLFVHVIALADGLCIYLAICMCLYGIYMYDAIRTNSDRQRYDEKKSIHSVVYMCCIAHAQKLHTAECSVWNAPSGRTKFAPYYSTIIIIIIIICQLRYCYVRVERSRFDRIKVLGFVSLLLLFTSTYIHILGRTLIITSRQFSSLSDSLCIILYR